MDKRYKHLNGEERGAILAEHRRGASLGAIGALLERSASTIGRELRRGRPEGEPAQPYCAHLGADRYRAGRKRCGRRRKLVKGGWLHDFVRGKLIHKRWSPEQIACKLRTMHPDDPNRLISHETIYAAIYAQPKGGLKAEMIAALRQHKPARGLRRTTLAGGSIAPESLRIIHRPEEIEARLVPGHCGMRRDRGRRCGRVSPTNDLINDQGGFQPLGRGHGGRAQDPLSYSQQFKRQAIDPGDRLQRRTHGCTADTALEGFLRQMKRLPAALRRSVTYDRGSDPLVVCKQTTAGQGMPCHPELARRLKIDIWLGRSARPPSCLMT